MKGLRLRYFVLGSLVIGIGLIALPVLLGSWQVRFPNLIGELVTKTGEALVIAAILAATVDLYVKERLAREVVKDLSPLMMSHALPQDLRDEVDNICGLRLFRRNLHIDYELRELEGSTAILLVSKTRYEFHNTSDVPQSVDHSLGVEKTHEGLQAIPQIRNAGAENVYNARGDRADYNEIGDLGQDIASGVERFWSCTIHIRPSKDGGEPATFWAETHQIFPAEYTDVFISIHPTLDMEVTVKAPPTKTVQVEFCHRLAHRTERYPPHAPETWRLRAAFLPHAAVLIEWRNRSPVALLPAMAVPPAL